MKKRFFYAGIIAAALFIGFSAFKRPNQDKKAFSNIIFKYIGPDESDAELQDPDNWSVLPALPMTNPCEEGDDIVCVTHLDEETLDEQEGDTDKEKFLYYLNNEVDPSDYVQSASNYRREE
jgi:hypothetical protein